MSQEAQDIYADSKVVPFRGEMGPAPPPNSSGLKGGGGGGTFDGMEPRIAALETHVEYIKRDLTDLKASVEAMRADAGAIKVNVATLTERVAHLPGKGFIVSVSSVIIGLLAALITFQQQIQMLVGAY